MTAPIALFTLSGTTDYAGRVAHALAVPLSPVEERDFEDGEHKVRPLAPVEGVDAYLIHALHGDAKHSVNDKLCRLLFLAGALKDHGAARVTAVLPYLCYARKDRRTQPQDPVTSRYVAAIVEAVGTDRVMAVQVHNEAAFDNSFRIPARHIETTDLFADHFAARALRETVVISPDSGGTKRAERFRRALERRTGRSIENGFIEKYRSGGVVSGGALIGDVRDRSAIILDDLIATGNTILRAASACRAAGATHICAAATHGLFSQEAKPLFASELLDEIVVTDSVPLAGAYALAQPRNLIVLSSAELVASAIGQAHGAS